MRKALALASLLAVSGVAFFINNGSHQSNAAVWTEKQPQEVQKAKEQNKVDASALNKLFVDLTKALSPTVVNVYTTSKIRIPRNHFGASPFGGGGGGGNDDIFRYFFGNPFGGDVPMEREAQALGSGFVINANEGLIVTNSHVVRAGENSDRNADEIEIKFLDDPERSKGHEAKVIGVDVGTDIAVLKLKTPRKGLQAAALGDSEKTEVGEWVLAIGNPYGHTHTVTKGIISAKGRALDSDPRGPGTRTDFFQTDASINPGNSGGPLFNIYGEVIGINTAIDARAQGIGFAIPINNAKRSITQLVEKGEVTVGWIGVGMSELDPQVAKELGLGEMGGVLIQQVFPGEPADKAGLKTYDVVTEVNGKKVETGRDFSLIVGAIPIGHKATMKVFRDGKAATITATVSKRKTESEIAKRFGEEVPGGAGGMGGKSAAAVGVAITDLTPEIRRQLRASPGMSGAVITQVLPGTPAAAAGLTAGYVITEINRKPIHNAHEAELEFAKKRDSHLLKLQRGSASVIVLLDMKARGAPPAPDEGDGGGE